MPIFKGHMLAEGERHVLLARAIRRARYDARHKGIPADVLMNIPLAEIDESYVVGVAPNVFQNDLINLYIRELNKTFIKTAITVNEARVLSGIRSKTHFDMIIKGNNVHPVKINGSEDLYLPVEIVKKIVVEARLSKNVLRESVKNSDKVHEAAVQEVSDLL